MCEILIYHVMCLYLITICFLVVFRDLHNYVTFRLISTYNLMYHVLCFSFKHHGNDKGHCDIVQHQAYMKTYPPYLCPGWDAGKISHGSGSLLYVVMKVVEQGCVECDEKSMLRDVRK